jgi:hypothetical protein
MSSTARARCLCAAVIISVAASTSIGSAAAAEVRSSKPASTSQLEKVLLARRDFPSGWTRNPQKSPTPDATSGFCNGPNAAARAQASGAVGASSTAFAKDPDRGPFVGETLYSFPDAGHAKAFMEANRRSLATCPAFDNVDATTGATVSVTLSQQEFAKIGDDRIALRQSERFDPTTTADFDIVYLRAGRLIVIVANGAISVDSKLTVHYARKSVGKLSALAS